MGSREGSASGHGEVFLKRSAFRIGVQNVLRKRWREFASQNLFPNAAPVRLFLDIALTKMMVRGGGTEIVIPFTDIKEIYSYDDLMEHDRNCQICKVVRPEDRSGAIII